MLKRVSLVLTVFIIIFTIGCNGTPTNSTNNSGQNIISPNTNNDNNNEESTTTPNVQDNTDEAKAFLKLFEGKTKTDNSKIEIKNGGKTIIYTYTGSNPNRHSEYQFQSTKNGTMAYYTEKFNPSKDLDNSLIDKDYYRYCVFEVKDGKLNLYEEANEEHKKRLETFKSTYFDDKGNIKPGIDASKVDFAPLMPKKSEIDFTKHSLMGLLQ